MVDIMFVGEAWGDHEADQGKPFVGKAGWVFNNMLNEAGIDRSRCYVTNVFNLQPRPTNDIKNLCGPRADGIKGRPALQKGKYVRAEYASELDRLDREVITERPNVICALGATAAWALLGTMGIMQIRGAPMLSELGYKILPTYHPSAVQHNWKLRPIVLSDFDKVIRESAYPEVRRPKREIWIEPTLVDIEEFYHKYIVPSSSLSVDIETLQDQITCIGFAPSTDRAIVVPFYSHTAKGKNYWNTVQEERRALLWVKKICEMEKSTYVGQNFMYDMQVLWRSYGIICPSQTDDTMLLHHAMQPEMQKGLGFLASIYTDEASWKFMGKGKGTLKKED